MGWNEKHPSLVQFFSATPELATISFQKYTQKPDTTTIFRIPNQTISPKIIARSLKKWFVWHFTVYKLFLKLPF